MEQQAQLHMHIEAKAEEPKVQEEGHHLLIVSLMQGDALPNNQAYLDGCSTVTTVKTDKYLKGIRMVPHRIKINCNAGAVLTDKMDSFGWLNAWYVPDGITNIFSMHKLEKHYRITYDSWEGYYIVHMPRGRVKFHKGKQGLPYINLDGSEQEAASMLMQMGKEQHAMFGQIPAAEVKHKMLVETV